MNFYFSNSEVSPVYEVPPPKYNAEQILTMLLDPALDKSKICQGKPSNVSQSATFIVDTRNLRHPDDIKKDEFGIWNYSGSHPQTYRVSLKEGGYLSIDKCGAGATGRNIVYLRRLYCTHPSNPSFKRQICFISGMYALCIRCLYYVCIAYVYTVCVENFNVVPSPGLH